MRSVDIFSSFTEDVLLNPRVHRQAGSAIALVRAGKNVQSKTVPTLVYLDAAISVCDAANEFFKWRAEAEITKQLRAENETLRLHLERLAKKAKLDFKELRVRTKAYVETRSQLRKEAHMLVRLAEEEVGQFCSQIHSMSDALECLMEKAPVSSKQASELSEALDIAIQQCLCFILRQTAS